MKKNSKLLTSWNLNLIISNDRLKNFEKEREIVKTENYKFINKWKDSTDYLEKPEVLKEALVEYEKLTNDFGTGGDESVFYGLMSTIKQTDSEVKAKLNQISNFSVKIYNDLQFFILNLSKVSETTQQEFLKSNSLIEYRHFLKNVFKFSKYTLSDKEEKILNLKHKVSKYNWVKMLSGILSKKEHKVLTEEGKQIKHFSEIVELISDRNKEIRDTSAKALNEIFKEVLEIAENEFNSVLENKKIDDELRGYERPDTPRHLGDDVDTELVDKLVTEVTENFDISRKYYELKAKLLGLSKLEYHERNIEYGKIKTKYSIEKAYEIAGKVFKNLDEEFSEIYEEMFKNGQVDAFPAKDKAGGAFCSTSGKKHPTYILLNHVDSLNNVLTLAHEFGHAINFELTKKKQSALNYDFPMATAETASTFFEDFVLQELLNEADDETRLAIMMMKLNDEVSTIFRQIAFYSFEREIHAEFRKKGYLSAVDIGAIFQKHMEAYMGNGVEQSEGSENWWIYVSHFRNAFYVYSYSFGLLVSKALQNMVKTDRNNIEKVKQFLAAGASASPKEIFEQIGINISQDDFWMKGINEVRELLEETETLAKKLGKIL